MADDVRRINEASQEFARKGTSMLNSFASMLLLPFDKLISLDPGFFFIMDRVHGMLFGWTKMFRPALDSIKVKSWIVNFLVAMLLLLGFTQFSAFIYYADCIVEVNDGNGFAVAAVVFTCMNTVFFLIYYISKNVVSRWYDVYCKSMLDNRAGIANIEFSSAASIMVFFVFTILFIHKYGFDSHLFNGSRAEFAYQFMATNLAATSFFNMVVVFYYINLFTVHAETHVLYERDHRKHNIDYIDAAISTVR